MANNKQPIGLITAGLLLGLILASLEQTIVATAMPTVIKEVGGLSDYSWVFTIYMLASTTTMPIYGKLADLFGRRIIYLTGLSIFLAGSVLCGFADHMVELIVFRGIQGLGAGALMPVAFTIIGDLFPPERLGKFMGLFGAVFALSSILGPALGGVIVEYWDWHWIFYINIPIGLPPLIIIAAALKESRSQEKRYIDWPGTLTLSGAVVAVLLALVLAGNHGGEGMHYGWGSVQVVGLFGLGAVLLALFLWAEIKVKEPIIPLHLFKIRMIAAGNIVAFFMSAGMFGAITYIPLYVQGVIGVGPSMAGYILTPLMLSAVVTSTASGRLMSKFSYRTILIPSMVLMTIGFVLLSQMTVETTKLQLVAYMIVTGLGMGAVYPTLGTAAQSAVDRKNRGVVTSSSQFFRSIGGMLGVSLLGSVLAQQMTSGLQGLGIKLPALSASQLQQSANPQMLLDSEARASLPQEVLSGLQNVLGSALSSVFWVGVIFVSAGLIASVFIGNARLVKASEGQGG